MSLGRDLNGAREFRRWRSALDPGLRAPSLSLGSRGDAVKRTDKPGEEPAPPHTQTIEVTIVARWVPFRHERSRWRSDGLPVGIRKADLQLSDRQQGRERKLARQALQQGFAAFFGLIVGALPLHPGVSPCRA